MTANLQREEMNYEIELRPFTWDDLLTVVGIVNRCEAVDQLERGVSKEELRADWQSPLANPEQNAFLAVVNGKPVGYGRIQLHKGQENNGFSCFRVFGKVLPAWRGRGIGTQILTENEQRARRRLGDVPTDRVYLDAYADERQESVIALYEKSGLEPVRYYLEMVYHRPEMPPAPDYPPGYSKRAFVPGQDEKTMWRVMNQSFQDHWGQIDRPFEEWLHIVESDHFSPRLAHLGVSPSGEVVGECLCAISLPEQKRVGRKQGWVKSLGVLRPHRQEGLGRALLLEGMRSLRERGCSHVLLLVDSENPTGALELYKSVGFRVRKTTGLYRKTLRD
jgi:mycothiol synthase